MNNNSPQPSFELPPLSPENAPGNVPAPEQVPARPEQYTQPHTPVAGQQSSLVPVMPIPAAPSAPKTSDDNTQPTNGPLVADDNDLIEKEWVVKAKQIVAATKDDPYRQTHEMSKFKADYLKKRYNKDVKVEGA